MLSLISAVLLVLVGLFHSVIGGKRLIAPIVVREGLPTILGSRTMSRVTLKAGWHLLTVMWFALAAVLVLDGLAIAEFRQLTLLVFGGTFVFCGVIALILSRGKHLSWAFFFPIGGILFWMALGG